MLEFAVPRWFEIVEVLPHLPNQACQDFTSKSFIDATAQPTFEHSTKIGRAQVKNQEKLKQSIKQSEEECHRTREKAGPRQVTMSHRGQPGGVPRGRGGGNTPYQNQNQNPRSNGSNRGPADAQNSARGGGAPRKARGGYAGNVQQHSRGQNRPKAKHRAPSVKKEASMKKEPTEEKPSTTISAGKDRFSLGPEKPEDTKASKPKVVVAKWCLTHHTDTHSEEDCGGNSDEYQRFAWKDLSLDGFELVAEENSKMSFPEKRYLYEDRQPASYLKYFCQIHAAADMLSGAYTFAAWRDKLFKNILAECRLTEVGMSGEVLQTWQDMVRQGNFLTHQLCKDLKRFIKLEYDAIEKHVCAKWLESGSAENVDSSGAFWRALQGIANESLDDDHAVWKPLESYRQQMLGQRRRELGDFYRKLGAYSVTLSEGQADDRVMLAFDLIGYGMVQYQPIPPSNSLALFGMQPWDKFLGAARGFTSLTLDVNS